MRNLEKHIVSIGLLLALLSCESGEIKKNQKITFDYFAPHNISEGSFLLQATASSGLKVTFLSGDTAIGKIQDSIIYLIKPGSVQITAIQKGNEQYYQAAQVTRTLTINDDINENKWNQIITFELNDSIWKVSQGQLKLNATSSSGLPVTFTSSNVAYASIKGNLLEVESAAIFGNDYGVFVTITASQAGNYVYNAALPVSRKLRVIHDVH
jgi:hypothetical protein